MNRLAEDPAATAGRSHESGRSARLVAAGILLSRLAGFVREAVLARYLGTSPFASAFRGGLKLPNVIQNLLGEGTLSASFIPVYVRLLERGDRRAAGRLAGAILSLMFMVVGAVSLLGSALAPVLVSITMPGFGGELRDTTIRCARILFPMTGVLALSAWALGILNSHRRFFVSYSAPVVWNAAIIGALVTMASRTAGADFVVAVSWGALIGGFAQFVVQLPWVLRLERSLDLRPDYRMPEVREVLRNAGPAILGRGAVQLSAYVDVFLASFLFSGAVAALNYAQTLYVLPVSLFGMSIAAAELPELSREGASPAVLNTRLATGLGRIAFFVVPSAVAFLLLGDVIVGALFQRGEFAPADTLLVSLILAGFGIGLLASTRARLFTSTFYALGDTRTPARIAAIRVAIAAVVGAALMFLLERYVVVARPLAIVAGPGPEGARPLGSVGLALGAGAASWFEWATLRRHLRVRLGASLGSPFVGRMIVAALAGAASARAVSAVLPQGTAPLPRGLAVLPVFGFVYLGLTRLLGVPTAAALLDRIRVTRRNGRG